MKRLILVGGGHAHVHCLADLAREPLRDVDVVLVSPYDRQVYSGMLPGWVAGHYPIEQCVMPLAPLARQAGVTFRKTRVTAIDPAARTVSCADGGEHSYDVLSLDTGTTFDPDAIPGAAKHALLVRPIEEFITGWEAARQRLATLQSGQVVMVGGGAAGIELLLSMQHALPHLGFTLVSAANTLPGSVGPRLARVLTARGVKLKASTAATRILQGQVELKDGTRLEADQAVVAIGATFGFTISAPGITLDDRGFVLVNDHLQSVSQARIFAAGDCATMQNHPRPKSGVYAVRAGPPLMRNLRKALAGDALDTYKPQDRSLYLISTGDRHAIGSWGSLAWQGDWVWRWKDRIDRQFVSKYTVA